MKGTINVSLLYIMFYCSPKVVIAQIHYLCLALLQQQQQQQNTTIQAILVILST
jgi:hypothetical protein